MGRIGLGELLLIALVILLIFGAQRLPQIGAALGKAVREVKSALKGDVNDDKEPGK